MKRIGMIFTTFILTALFSASVQAVEPGTFLWEGHSIEMKQANEGGMFAPAGMTDDEYCVTLVFAADAELSADKDTLEKFYAEALLADPSGNTYAPEVWLTGSDDFSFMYAIPKEVSIGDLTASFASAQAAPVEEKAAPAEEKTAPAEEEAAPAEEEAAPAEEEAAPAEEEAAPAEEEAASAEEAAPVEEKATIPEMSSSIDDSKAEAETKPEETKPEETKPEEAKSEETQSEEDLLDETLISRILDALGNETYRSTRELLKGGEAVGNGSRGDAGSGLQQMLVDFGCDITVDGIVGNQTIGALHQIQESFSLPAADSVDLEAYDKLLPLLLLKKDEEAADDLLYDYFEETGGTGYYDYLKGCALYAQGKYYSAKEAFEYSSYGNSAERAASCQQEWPANGEIWHNPDMYAWDTSLTFTVNSFDESRGICFEMFTADGRLAAVLLVKGTGSATASLPVGTYRIRDCYGDEWYGMSEKFGRYGFYYEYLTFSEDENTKYDAYLDYGSYQLTINASESAEGSTSVGSTSIGWDDVELDMPDGM